MRRSVQDRLARANSWQTLNRYVASMQQSNTDHTGGRPAILATRNPDATMYLASLRWKALPDGTLLLECPGHSTTAANLHRDPFCWVVVHRGGLPGHEPDDSTEVHLVGKGFIEALGETRPQGRGVVRFCPDL